MANNIKKEQEALPPLVENLLSQYESSENLRQLVQGFDDLVNQYIISPAALAADVFSSLDLASKGELDSWGERIGFPRPSITSANSNLLVMDLDPLDTKPMGVTDELTESEPLSDPLYRALLKASFFSTSTDCTTETLNLLLQLAFSEYSGDAYVVNNPLQGGTVMTLDVFVPIYLSDPETILGIGNRIIDKFPSGVKVNVHFLTN